MALLKLVCDEAKLDPLEEWGSGKGRASRFWVEWPPPNLRNSLDPKIPSFGSGLLKTLCKETKLVSRAEWGSGEASRLRVAWPPPIPLNPCDPKNPWEDNSLLKLVWDEAKLVPLGECGKGSANVEATPKNRARTALNKDKKRFLYKTKTNIRYMLNLLFCSISINFICSSTLGSQIILSEVNGCFFQSRLNIDTKCNFTVLFALELWLKLIKVCLHIRFTHAFSTLHCNFLLLTLIEQNQDKLLKKSNAIR